MSTDYPTTPAPSAPPAYAPAPARPASVHLPLALLALAFALFLFSQIRSVGEQSDLLRWQIKNAETQDKNLKDGEKQLRELSVQRETLVRQSTEIQQKYQQILNDVLDLAKDDKDAREVVEQYKIQRANPPASATPAPASGAAPAGDAAPAAPAR